MSPAAARRAVLDVLAEHGPCLPGQLDGLAGLTPRERVLAVTRLYGDGVIEPDGYPAQGGPLRWRLTRRPRTDAAMVYEAADLHDEGQTANVALATAVPRGTNRPDGHDEEEREMADQGTWTNRAEGGAVLATSNDVDGVPSWDVWVEGAKHPIPVIAAFESQIEPVITANRMRVERIEAATRPHLPGSILPGATNDEEKTVTEQIADGLAQQGDDIDSLLDAAAKGEGTQADAEAPRPAKPDPKPAAKGKGKPAAKTAAKGKAAAKPTSRAATTRKAQAEKRDAAKAAPAAKAPPAKGGTRAGGAKGGTRPAVDLNAVKDEAKTLWNDPEFAADVETVAARRKAIREALDKKFKISTKGKIMGFLNDRGIDGRNLPVAK